MKTADTIAIKTNCPFCKKEQTIEVNENDYNRWRDGGVLLQDAFPHLDADEREALKTGICSDCWDEMFS